MNNSTPYTTYSEVWDLESFIEGGSQINRFKIT